MDPELEVLTGVFVDVRATNDAIAVDLVGSGIGPLIFAWVRITVSAILRADSSTTSWS